MGGELKNCPGCGALFVKEFRSICSECFKEEEKDFQLVYSFIRKRENRQATVTEVVDSTGVTNERIMKFVKERRLQPAQFPNLHYKCESCGEALQQGRLCENCRNSLQKGWQQESEKAARDNRPKSSTYFSLKRGRK